MHNKDKHKLFSKEELLRLIDEQKSMPADADDFDREAMEGLALVKDRARLEKLDAEIEAVLANEHRKASRKRNLYYFAAAASVLLIIGLFFLVKENTLGDKELADTSIETQKNSITTENPPPAFSVADPAGEAAATRTERKSATPQEQQEVTALEGKLAEQTTRSGTFASDVTVVKEGAMDELKNANSEQALADVPKFDQNAAGGKAEMAKYKSEQDGENQRDDSKGKEKKPDEANKETEDRDKKRVLTNTVWTAAGSGNTGKDEEAQDKQQQTTPETKAAVAVDTRSAPATSSNTSNTTAQPVQSGEEVAANEKVVDEKTNGPQKAVSQRKETSHKSGTKKRTKSAEPRASAADNAGYSSYAQTGAREYASPEFIGGNDALQQFIRNNLPISAPDKQGTVTVEFTVKSTGAVDTTGLKVVKGVKDCEECSDDVLRLMKKMPAWQPATENGKAKESRQKLSVPYNSGRAKK